MRTRSGASYPVAGDKRLSFSPESAGGCRKRRRHEESSVLGFDFFDSLPDDLVLAILRKLSSTASSPADLAAVFSTCKRLKMFGEQPMVLAAASPRALAVKAKSWCEQAHSFLKRCAQAGNLEACYFLGMIKFYCFEKRGCGARLMVRAAIAGHADALYSLAVIQFNGSGGAKHGKDLRAGVALAARAASLGHINALRELGHCLQDGYGVQRNVAEGRKLLIQANARELASAVALTPCQRHMPLVAKAATALSALSAANVKGAFSLLSDFGWSVPESRPPPANKFLVDWFEKMDSENDGMASVAAADELRMCSHANCGRRETRKHEFRRCSVCGSVNYCSRACQALDWKFRHKANCAPTERWVAEVAAAAAGGDLVGAIGAG